ncbi:MAG: ABC transporter ATP-binding protein [Odoribacteraceae bacterium]|jgi:iron complex transport system ATP-binding protein|nr:ABC transporter ATP-binding protein [Odoribacteraceae bacterium]
MNHENAIEINDLRCGYHGRVILDVPRLIIPAGELVAVIGPNGSGKTTLARAVSGIISPYRGTIRVNGQEIARLSHRARARALAVVNQSVEADTIAVEDYVLMGRLPHRPPTRLFETIEEIAIARENMHLAGIQVPGNTPMDRLSGGERQLAAIARALTQQAGTLLLDEPTAHLDIAHQVQVLDLVRRLNRERGITVMLVIHDLNLAGEYSDRVILLDNGTPRFSGTPTEVLTPDNIERVYGARVVILPDPLSRKPRIFPVTGESSRGPGKDEISERWNAPR